MTISMRPSKRMRFNSVLLLILFLLFPVFSAFSEKVEDDWASVKIVIHNEEITSVIPKGKTVTVPIDFFNIPASASYVTSSIENEKICKTKWGEWNGNMSPLLISGEKEGSTKIKISVDKRDDIAKYIIVSVIPFDLSDNSKWTPTEFQFRDIPWGTSFSDTIASMGMKTYHWANMGNRAHVSVLDSVFHFFDGDKYADEVGKYYWCSEPEDISVAGHKLDSIWLYYAYDYDENNNAIDQEKNKLYHARYTFRVRDFDDDYNDLLTKLTSIYGTPLQSGGTSNQYLKSHYCNVWIGNNSTIMYLEKGYDVVSSEPQINLSYASLKGNRWLFDVYETIVSNEKEKMKNDTDGL